MTLNLAHGRKDGRNQIFLKPVTLMSQVREVATVLAGRHNPAIIMGDFNSEWLNAESIVELLAERAGLHGYKPLSEGLVTYPSSGRRLDWILISDQFVFSDYKVLPNVLSDHLAVVAEINPGSPALYKRIQHPNKIGLKAED
jgi:endonuclease/exonuclease/phosphatase (EEP) superfamily protein YafD